MGVPPYIFLGASALRKARNSPATKAMTPTTTTAMNFLDVGPNPEMAIWRVGMRNINATITTPTTIRTIPNDLLDILLSCDHDIDWFIAPIVPKTKKEYVH